MINNVTLMGRLTKDPDLKITQSQVAISRFTLAVDRFKKGGEKEADFINCVAFGKTAEFIAEKAKKGGRVAVGGNIKTGSYENKQGQRVYTTDVNCVTVQIIDWAEEKTTFADMTPTSDGDIPF